MVALWGSVQMVAEVTTAALVEGVRVAQWKRTPRHLLPKARCSLVRSDRPGGTERTVVGWLSCTSSTSTSVLSH